MLEKVNAQQPVDTSGCKRSTAAESAAGAAGDVLVMLL